MNETTHPRRRIRCALAHQRPPHAGARHVDAARQREGRTGSGRPAEAAVQGAHDTIDRLADSAAPAVQQLGERVPAAGEALHAKADQLRDTRDEWVEACAATVRSNPWPASLLRSRWAP